MKIKAIILLMTVFLLSACFSSNNDKNIEYTENMAYNISENVYFEAQMTVYDDNSYNVNGFMTIKKDGLEIYCPINTEKAVLEGDNLYINAEGNAKLLNKKRGEIIFGIENIEENSKFWIALSIKNRNNPEKRYYNATVNFGDWNSIYDLSMNIFKTEAPKIELIQLETVRNLTIIDLDISDENILNLTTTTAITAGVISVEITTESGIVSEVEIDWGDGTTTSALKDGDNHKETLSQTHNYSKSGTYKIKVTAKDYKKHTSVKYFEANVNLVAKEINSYEYTFTPPSTIKTGVSADIPSQVLVYFNDGSYYPYDIEWIASSTGDYTIYDVASPYIIVHNAGTYEIKGKVNVEIDGKVQTLDVSFTLIATDTTNNLNVDNVTLELNSMSVSYDLNSVKMRIDGKEYEIPSWAELYASTVAGISLDSSNTLYAYKGGTYVLEAAAYDDAGVKYTSEFTITVIDKRTIIKFNDKNLETAVRKKISDYMGTPSYDGEIFKEMTDSIITALDWVSSTDSEKITDLTGIEMLTGLDTLILNNNNITDISLLENLNNLTYLEIAENKITAIDKLGNLKKLEHLKADDNQISDLTGLNNASNLKTLKLARNQLTQVNGISGLNLEVLDLQQNSSLMSIQGLQGMTTLKELRLYATAITTFSLDNIKDNVNMEGLFLGETNIDSIEGLASMSNLLELDLNATKLKNDSIDIITQFKSLKRLHLSGIDTLTKIDGLESMTNLEYLNISYTVLDVSQKGITGDIAGYLGSNFEYTDEYCINILDNILNAAIKTEIGINPENKILENDAQHLIKLSITNAGITTLDGIQYFTNLEYLNISDNPSITELPDMSGMALRELHAKGTGISNIDNLGIMTSLEILDLSNTQIAKDTNSAQMIGNQSNLKKLSVSFNSLNNTFISEMIKNKTNLTILEMRGNDFSDSNFTGFSTMSNLESLDVSENNLGGTLFGSLFGSMTKLRILNLNNNKFTVWSESAVNTQGISKIEEIYLSGNQFTDFYFTNGYSPIGITLTMNLRVLDVSRNTSLEYISIDESSVTVPNFETLNASSTALSGFYISNANQSLKNIDLSYITSLYPGHGVFTLSNHASNFSPEKMNFEGTILYDASSTMPPPSEILKILTDFFNKIATPSNLQELNIKDTGLATQTTFVNQLKSIFSNVEILK